VEHSSRVFIVRLSLAPAAVGCLEMIGFVRSTPDSACDWERGLPAVEIALKLKRGKNDQKDQR
jgi:hypothetical protein